MRQFLLVVLVTFLTASSITGSPASGETSAVVAPIQVLTGQGRPAGFCPPWTGSQLRDYEPHPHQFPEPPPIRFDWRERGKVTPVKDQGNCGSCYAFGALANFESAVLVAGGQAHDFSENNVKECDWWAVNTGLGSCNGGNYHMVASFLSQKGTVVETCDPYAPRDVVCKGTCPYIYTLLGWSVISGDHVPHPDVLKSYIQCSGPLFVAMNATSGSGWPAEFSSYDGSYTLYYEGPGSVDHAVLIVGWDDTLSHGGGQGAWIVKNSWGTDWGGTCGYGTERGYFTIAYGSAQIGKYASTIYDWQEHDPDGVLLYHDEAGWMGTTVGFSDATAWGLCKLVLTETILAERVEFWTTDVTVDVDVYIYDDFSGGAVSNLLASELDNSFNESGYHSVELSMPFVADSGADIYVVVILTNASYDFPIATDSYGVTSPGHCFVSSDGTSWIDVTTLPGCSTCDLCIRLRGTGALSKVTERDLPAVPGLELVCSENLGSQLRLRYSLPSDGWVSLTIHDVQGRCVATLVDDYKQAGEHSRLWSGLNHKGRLASPGVYFARLAFGKEFRTRKLILLR
jgi:C1A family cysteine protease